MPNNGDLSSDIDYGLEYMILIPSLQEWKATFVHPEHQQRLTEDSYGPVHLWLKCIDKKVRGYLFLENLSDGLPGTSAQEDDKLLSTQHLKLLINNVQVPLTITAGGSEFYYDVKAGDNTLHISIENWLHIATFSANDHCSGRLKNEGSYIKSYVPTDHAALSMGETARQQDLGANSTSMHHRYRRLSALRGEASTHGYKINNVEGIMTFHSTAVGNVVDLDMRTTAYKNSAANASTTSNTSDSEVLLYSNGTGANAYSSVNSYPTLSSPTASSSSSILLRTKSSHRRYLTAGVDVGIVSDSYESSRQSADFIDQQVQFVMNIFTWDADRSESPESVAAQLAPLLARHFLFHRCMLNISRYEVAIQPEQLPYYLRHPQIWDAVQDGSMHFLVKGNRPALLNGKNPYWQAVYENLAILQYWGQPHVRLFFIDFDEFISINPLKVKLFQSITASHSVVAFKRWNVFCTNCAPGVVDSQTLFAHQSNDHHHHHHQNDKEGYSSDNVTIQYPIFKVSTEHQRAKVVMNPNRAGCMLVHFSLIEGDSKIKLDPDIAFLAHFQNYLVYRTDPNSLSVDTFAEANLDLDTACSPSVNWTLRDASIGYVRQIKIPHRQFHETVLVSSMLVCFGLFGIIMYFLQRRVFLQSLPL